MGAVASGLSNPAASPRAAAPREIVSPSSAALEVHEGEVGEPVSRGKSEKRRRRGF
jgi:hypothetical protein